MKANYLVILACIGVSLWTWQIADQDASPQDEAFVEQNLVFSADNLLAGRLWTLVTALFVHANPLHLLGNMVFLFVFGNTLEKMIGRENHLLVFFVGGFTAFLLSIPFFSHDTGMVGASAAIFTLAACVMVMRPLKWSWLFLAPQGLVAIIYFTFNVILVSAPSLSPAYDPGVAYVAHVIGFVVGVPLGIAWSSEWKRNLAVTIGLLSIYLGMISVASSLLGNQSIAAIVGTSAIVGVIILSRMRRKRKSPPVCAA